MPLDLSSGGQKEPGKQSTFYLIRFWFHYLYKEFAMKNLIHCTAGLAFGAMLIPATGMAAEGLSYGYLEGSYINLDVDQPNEDSVFREDFDNGGGYGINLSLPLSERFFLYGGYSDTESDFTFSDNTGAIVPGDTDVLKFNLGLGLILPMSDKSDVVFSGGYSDIDYDDFDFGATNDPDVNDLRDDPSDGWTADAYLRSQLAQSVESTIGARYTDIEGIDGVSFIGSLMFEMNQNWGINVSVDAGDELVTWGAGIRYSF